MPIRRRVIPEISEVEACGIKVFSVAAVVLEVAPAVPAGGNRQTNSIEDARVPFREIQKRIMGRIELPSSRVCAFHAEGDPMSELHPLIDMRRKMITPFGKRIDE